MNNLQEILNNHKSVDNKQLNKREERTTIIVDKQIRIHGKALLVNNAVASTLQLKKKR